MNLSRPADLRAQVQKLWDKGELLAGGEAAFPRRLVLKGPTSDELAQRFDSVRAWIAELQAMPHCRIELRQVAHRVLGANAVPQTAWVDNLDAALAWIGKRREAERYRTLCAVTMERQPALLPWLARRPLRALELADAWSRLLDVVEWMRAHPRCGLYLRQLDIVGVHSKFIEMHRGVLGELLELALPADAIDAAAAGAGQFLLRYGFREKPARIRFRVLDDALAILPGTRQADITLDAASFAALAPSARRVFVTENEINFLAFPAVPDSLAIFGAGYGWDALAQARWLERCALHYWGDIDTHGYAILDQLRSRFPHAQSLLMDRATPMAHQPAWGHEPDQVAHDLLRLNEDERMLYDALRDNLIQPGLRLEQERIGFYWLEQALHRL
jgi:hypothetical protein